MDWHQLWTIISLPDNIPIIGLMFLIPFFTWYGLRQAFANDRLVEQLDKDPQLAKTHHRKAQPYQKGWAKDIHVWPYLLRIELLAAIIITAILMVWSIALKAPIEEPANPAKTPNPSKAPWYFLGLQEMLVYFDPWIAGVLLPGLIIVGLMAIPYIDTNPKGNGYYTFRERKWEIAIFLFGFVVLWVWLIIIGTFLRGPNQNFFGPFEYWDSHKLVPLINVEFSQLMWVKLLGMGLPSNPFVREIFGLVLVAAYFLALPPLMAKRWMRGYLEKMGAPRFFVMALLLLTMLSLPIKMLLRWTMNLHFLVAMPEAYFNI